MKSKQSGFTLIEVVAVAALLGVLVYNEAIKGEKPYSMEVISAVKLELVFAFSLPRIIASLSWVL